MAGFKDKDKKFHPTDVSSKGVSKGSLENDQMMDNPGNADSKKELKIEDENKDLRMIIAKNDVMEKLEKEKHKAQLIQDDARKQSENSPEMVNEENFFHYEGYESGIITVRNLIKDNPDISVFDKLDKEKERANKEIDKAHDKDDDEHENHYDGYLSAIHYGIGLLK